MKKISFLIVFVMLSFTINVSALNRSSNDLKNRNVCSKIELAKANTDGSITKVECYNDYNTAKNKMNETDDNSLIILERSNNVTKVIDAKYALVYLDRGDKVTYLYSSSSLSSTVTYMDNYERYGATDAALLDMNYNNKAIKIRIAGVNGWVKNGEYIAIVPVNWVKSWSYYKVTDSGFYHYYAKDIENTGYAQSNRLIDSKPSFLEKGNYRSFDGIYFYNNFIDMIDDYKTGKSEKAVNKDNAYYNYYQYLPHRSKTRYDIDDIDSYIRNVLGFKGSIYGRFQSSKNSVMYGSSEYYLFAEKKYGANALSIFSLGRHESSNGTSSIAYGKNNIFGHSAYDGSAYNSATGYLDVRSSIFSHGYGYVNSMYAKVGHSYYNGSHFGNKGTGMNVMYASDVYWGEKAASLYYEFDKANGLLDKDYYQLIVSTTSDIRARTAPNTSSSIAYTIKKANIPFIVLEEVHGETVGGSDIWYKVQSDSNISNDGKIISGNSSWPEYNWDGVVYVHSNYFKKINDAKNSDGTYNKPNNVKKDVNNSTLTTNADKSKYTPEVGIISGDKDYYYTSTLASKKGTIKNGSYVVILEKVVTGDNTSYLIITDYGTVQKAWISSDNVRILKKDLLNTTTTEAKKTISVLDKAGGSSVLTVYGGSFIPIVDKYITGGKTYLKVQYKIADSILYGYVDGSISDISYTLNYINVAPVINATDQNVIINESFNPLSGVTGTDNEDGNITNKIKIESNNVNTSKLGTYEVKYSLTDSYGDTTYKTIKVNVVNRTESNALFMFNGLKQQENNKFIFSGFIAVKGMDNKNIKKELIFVHETTKKEYKFDLTTWTDYPYEMTSVDDKKEYDYKQGWFNTTIELSKDVIPNGNYNIYVHVINGTYEAKTLFTNIAYIDMTRRAKGDNREFVIDVDYSTLNSPLVFGIRDQVISLDVPKSNDPMYNFFTEMKLDNNNLTIKGTSHSYGVRLATSDTVTRKLIFESTTDFNKYEYDLGSITNGDYQVTLAVSDNLDKTRAWYNKTIDLTSLPKGSYIVYIENTVNNVSYYGEIIDASYTDFSKINNSIYKFSRNDNVRLRLELNKT